MPLMSCLDDVNDGRLPLSALLLLWQVKSDVAKEYEGRIAAMEEQLRQLTSAVAAATAAPAPPTKSVQDYK
jgi:hypothetical protein